MHLKVPWLVTGGDVGIVMILNSEIVGRMAGIAGVVSNYRFRNECFKVLIFIALATLSIAG